MHDPYSVPMNVKMKTKRIGVLHRKPAKVLLVWKDDEHVHLGFFRLAERVQVHGGQGPRLKAQGSGAEERMDLRLRGP